MKKFLVFLTLTVVILMCLVSCGQTEHTHKFGEWSVTKNATCTEDGVKTRYCECGEKQSDVIPYINHTEQTIPAKEATCSETGLTEGKKCFYCGKILSPQEIVNKKSHTEEIIPAVESSCTVKGLTEGKKCSVCGEILVAQHEAPLKAHTEVIDKAVSATCTKTGLTEGKHCSVCKTTLVARQEIPVVAHTYDDKYDESCNECGYVRDIKYSEGLKYALNYDGESYTVVGIGSCTDTEVVIPSTFEGKPVTIIGHGAFVLSSHIISMYIPETVLEILCDEWYGNPFLMCSNLEKFEVDEANPAYRSVDGSLYTKDGETLIRYASGRKNKEFAIPESVINIGTGAFQFSAYLENVVIPDNVINLGNSAFGSCINLKYVRIGSGVTNMSTPFLLCSNLLNVEISSDNKSYKSFNGDIYSKDGTVLLQYALGKTDLLFNVPNGVTSIGEHSFRGCVNLKNIVIPNGVTTIDYYAFDGCTNLSSIMIPESLTKFGERVFQDCTNLTSITIPENVTEIGEFAFYECTNLTSVYITSIESWLKISFSYGANPCTYGADLYLNGELLTQLTIPDSITSISEYAFSGCTSITSVSIPDSVTSIEYGAFMNCTNLQSVTLEYGITCIRSSLFAGCTNLTSIVIPNSVTRIDNNIFDDSSSLADIYYTGTKEEWAEISINSTTNTIIENATIHYNYVPEE